MPKPKLSVLMANYNHSRFLETALTAILEQSRQPDEIIVVDDASTDDSVEVLTALARQSPLIRVERNERNLGVVVTFNRLVDMAKGDYVYGAAADDMVLPGLFEKSLHLLAEHPRAGLCSCLARLMDEKGHDTKLLPTPMIAGEPVFLPPGEVLRTLRRQGSWVMGNTALFRRAALLELGGFRPELHSFCDGFFHQVLALRHGACFIPEPLASWRRLEGGFASQTAGDLDRALDIMQAAGNLMRTTYRDLFPESYIADWEKTWLWTAAHGVTSRQYAAQRESLARLGELSPRPKGPSEILMAGLRFLAFVQRLAMEAYNFVRFGGYPLKWLRIQWLSRRGRRRLRLTTGPDPRFSAPRPPSSDD